MPTQQFQALLNQEALKMQQNNQTEQNIDGSVLSAGV